MGEKVKKSISQFRLIAFLEGISYILLLFVAMPIKYIYGIPEATKIIGMTHGILFVIFLYLLFVVYEKYNWGFKWLIIAFISSIVPFGTFFIDKKIKSYTIPC